jgi:hypothetical protein
VALDDETGPRVVFDDGTQSIHLADLSGLMASPIWRASGTGRSATGPTSGTAASAPRSRWIIRRSSITPTS